MIPRIQNNNLRSDLEYTTSEERISNLLFALEKRLNQNEDIEFRYEDIAFQLTDFKRSIDKLNKKRGQVENIYYFMQIFLSLVIVGMLTYMTSLALIGELPLSL